MIYQGDCIDILPTLDAESVDSIVTDPPYGLSFMGKDWDHGVPGVPFWEAALRVAKPGAFMLAFGGTRTFHRLAVAIEDAGWEIRDTVMWVYGSGFPKSHNVGLRIDKLHGAPDRGHRIATANRYHPDGTLEPNGELLPAYEAKTEQGKKWQGWGTALKPAWEPIIVARKPIVGTVANNVMKYGTGAINIDGCRVNVDLENEPNSGDSYYLKRGKEYPNQGKSSSKIMGTKTERVGITIARGRFPANLIHDGSQEVLDLFPQTKSGSGIKKKATGTANGIFNINKIDGEYLNGDSGSAARFFYCAKASKQDRDEGCGELPLSDCGMMEDDNYPIKTGSGNLRETKRRNNHPTVKPTSLMRYLCKLVTPPGGTILDPFMGSGSTGKAAALEGFRFIGIELEKEYTAIAEKRIMSAQPLFAGLEL